MRPFLIGSYQNWIKFTINTFQFLRSTLTLSTSVWIQKEKLGSAKPRGRLKSRVNLFSTLDSTHTPVCTQMLFPQKKNHTETLARKGFYTHIFVSSIHTNFSTHKQGHCATKQKLRWCVFDTFPSGKFNGTYFSLKMRRCGKTRWRKNGSAEAVMHPCAAPRRSGRTNMRLRFGCGSKWKT